MPMYNLIEYSDNYVQKHLEAGLFARNCKNFVNAIPLSDLIFVSIK